MQVDWRSSQFPVSAGRRKVTRDGSSSQWAVDARADIAPPITLRNGRSVGGCLGYVRSADDGRVVGGCVGTIDNSCVTPGTTRPVGGCVGFVYSRNHTRYVGGCRGAIELM
jgi:hypothetical protein